MSELSCISAGSRRATTDDRHDPDLQAQEIPAHSQSLTRLTPTATLALCTLRDARDPVLSELITRTHVCPYIVACASCRRPLTEVGSSERERDVRRLVDCRTARRAADSEPVRCGLVYTHAELPAVRRPQSRCLAPAVQAQSDFARRPDARDSDISGSAHLCAPLR